MPTNYHKSPACATRSPASTRARSMRSRNLHALHADFARYTGPVLCAWGRRDRYIPVAGLRAVKRVYPHAQTLILEDSAHQPMIEQPHLLGPTLRAFLTI